MTKNSTEARQQHVEKHVNINFQVVKVRYLQNITQHEGSPFSVQSTFKVTLDKGKLKKKKKRTSLRMSAGL